MTQLRASGGSKGARLGIVFNLTNNGSSLTTVSVLLKVKSKGLPRFFLYIEGIGYID
jgi:hypothetical protein